MCVSGRSGVRGRGKTHTVFEVGHDQVEPFAQDDAALGRGRAEEVLLLRLVGAGDGFFEVVEIAAGHFAEHGGGGRFWGLLLRWLQDIRRANR